MKRIFLVGALLAFSACGRFSMVKEKKTYQFKNEPIDVVIPCCKKDKKILDLCIEGIRKNGKNIRRVIVLSAKRLTDQAEWFDESLYSFTKDDIIDNMFTSKKEAEKYRLSSRNRAGWLYQQLLKLYAFSTIPGLSSNVLLLDADTVFINPVSFLTERKAGMFNIGKEYHKPYFAHAKRFIPGLKRLYEKKSGICHHMLIQKDIIDDLFAIVEKHHKKLLWQVFCQCIDKNEYYGSGASEYEIYFNFSLARSNQLKIRKLKWTNVANLNNIDRYKRKGYHYISCHTYMN